MLRLIKRLLCSFLFLLLVKSLSGEVILPSVLSDHMVLQQFSWITLWGRADRGEGFTVFTSWDSKNYSIQADQTGQWKLKLFSGGPGGPYTIRFTGKNKVELRDVMLGEVWFCSGQSNMEFTLNMLGGWKYYSGLKKQIDSTDLRKIRLCTIGQQVSQHPSDSCKALWLQADASSILNFSSTAFYFGLEIYKKFNVPVGLIVSSWGGTPAEAWTPNEYLKDTPGLSYYLNHPNNPEWEASAPSVLFNGMIYPLRYYTIKGVIWYQGESNRYDCDLYATLFKTMILSWRKYWEKPDLPFYFVQIAPYDYKDFEEASGFLREAQEKALELKNTGMAVTLDIGNIQNIHPKNKQQVGRRLALLAFAGTYSQADPASFSGPAYRLSRIEGDKIQVFFKNSDALGGRKDFLSGFRVAGSDGIFRQARAVFVGNSVMAGSTDVPSPKYLRYAFLNTDTASVFDQSGLPAGSFRTDSLAVNYREVHLAAAFDSVKKFWKISPRCPDPTAVIRFTTDGSMPALSSAVSSDTITITTACRVNTKAFLKNVPSQSSSSISFIGHEALGSNVVFTSKPSEKFHGNTHTLTDGINGSEDFHDGRWLGFQYNDFQAMIDLMQPKLIGSVKINFLINTASYIFPPTLVEIFASENGQNFIKAGEFKLSAPDSSSLIAQPKIISITIQGIKRPVRFIKVIAKNQKTNPPWHYAPGQKCWLFVDEVECRK